MLIQIFNHRLIADDYPELDQSLIHFPIAVGRSNHAGIK